MAAPIVTILYNDATEGAPNWVDIGVGDTIYFTGPDSTVASIDPVTAPVTGTKIAEELWIGASGTYAECDTVYDGTVNENQYVLQVYFEDNPTSTAPILTYYDSSAHGADPADEIAAGTADTSNTGWIKAIETTGGAPGAAWCAEDTATAGADDVNCLDGDQRYVQCAAVALADTAKYFNIVCYCPSDATAGTVGHDGVLSVRYTYT